MATSDIYKKFNKRTFSPNPLRFISLDSTYQEFMKFNITQKSSWVQKYWFPTINSPREEAKFIKSQKNISKENENSQLRIHFRNLKHWGEKYASFNKFDKNSTKSKWSKHKRFLSLDEWVFHWIILNHQLL